MQAEQRNLSSNWLLRTYINTGGVCTVLLVFRLVTARGVCEKNV